MVVKILALIALLVSLAELAPPQTREGETDDALFNLLSNFADNLELGHHSQKLMRSNSNSAKIQEEMGTSNGASLSFADVEKIRETQGKELAIETNDAQYASLNDGAVASQRFWQRVSEFLRRHGPTLLSAIG